ncbi:MAG: ParB/RepB/Spo0J family partition protein [Thalassolituus sp.]|jgi:ParB family chromosome partitioning protein|uniref:Chromosome (Plasmid) partitioning protein ParB n=2 Tax=root TaxID=1 RepID=A0A160TC61_9ZZZZ|nr:ParB/RepB/Spo0J family partition protein [Thalassolituus oleivorans]PCI47305.1 MAG: chromosome partitioning protein ParB [Oceanospirillales bacterium]AHK17120.1 chromosome partitioning protein ParB [Thalassolituus oleivorans R6-15]APR65526.1 chromosome partitioning protein ParB [Thalassolituus oleivorans]MBQ0726213.1 ParB/RepB/Spo0J family partition protein [Thalassolituus oleivorans]MCA6126951.1 chromosome partitioning protein ParB [Thalassolituus oleivorans 4BN06-13]
MTTTKRKRGLGRGLDALLASSRAAAVPTEPLAEGEESQPVKLPEGELRHLPIEFVQPGRYQPRQDIQPEALEELAASIRAQGLMQPIVVRPLPGQDDRFEIIAGERRWRACQLAGMDRVPALVRDVPDSAAIAMALIENIQRENLNPMEEAMALHRLQHEFELTQMEVAEAVGKNRATVANLLRLMNLNEDVKRLLEHGDIEMGHARALLGLDGQAQSDAGVQVVSRALTVRQTEALVRHIQSGANTESKPTEKPNPDVQRLERMLGDRLGAKVAIQHTAKGKGKLVISYTNLDELDGILEHIK